ncbi:EamA family transporter [Solitalea lacus]|uniref:EamA family transporter n=1 Tax=Solitalea lacus TaxID=2911172 RepID=UPI001EDBE9C2|nr:EamA family transporter [Solitalea lacus]UKJ06587.1 EamA family transporter [Solitalea lacus]
MKTLNNTLREPSKIAIILAFTSIYLIWGSTYLGIMVAIQSIPPMILGGLRFLIAGVLLLGWCLYNKEKLPSKSTIIKSSISGLLLLLWGNGAVIWAEQYIASSITAIIVAGAPLWMALLDKREWKHSFSSLAIISGLLIGFSGVVILVTAGKETTHFSLSDSKQFLGLLVLLSGSIAWVGGSLFTKYSPTEGSTLMKVSIQMLVACVAFFLVAAIRGEYQTYHWQQTTTKSWLALGYLITFGSLIGYLSYVWLLSVRSPAQVGTYAYVNPSVAVLLGWLMLNEPISLQQALSLGVILIGVMLVNKGNSKKAKAAALTPPKSSLNEQPKPLEKTLVLVDKQV